MKNFQFLLITIYILSHLTFIGSSNLASSSTSSSKSNEEPAQIRMFLSGFKSEHTMNEMGREKESMEDLLSSFEKTKSHKSRGNFSRPVKPCWPPCRPVRPRTLARPVWPIRWIVPISPVLPLGPVNPIFPLRPESLENLARRMNGRKCLGATAVIMGTGIGAMGGVLKLMATMNVKLIKLPFVLKDKIEMMINIFKIMIHVKNKLVDALRAVIPLLVDIAKLGKAAFEKAIELIGDVMVLIGKAIARLQQAIETLAPVFLKLADQLKNILLKGIQVLGDIIAGLMPIKDKLISMFLAKFFKKPPKEKQAPCKEPPNAPPQPVQPPPPPPPPQPFPIPAPRTTIVPQNPIVNQSNNMAVSVVLPPSQPAYNPPNQSLLLNLPINQSPIYYPQLNLPQLQLPTSAYQQQQYKVNCPVNLGLMPLSHPLSLYCPQLHHQNLALQPTFITPPYGFLPHYYPAQNVTPSPPASPRSIPSINLQEVQPSNCTSNSSSCENLKVNIKVSGKLKNQKEFVPLLKRIVNRIQKPQ